MNRSLECAVQIYVKSLTMNKTLSITLNEQEFRVCSLDLCEISDNEQDIINNIK